MKGAEALLRTLLAGHVDVCFTNPGTSEMQFVAALDRVPAMRGVLTLFEGVATGAADGYARMADKPAVTLLHLGPGLANGLANLHNARRANSPLINIVGEHATTHLQYDAPLTSDIVGFARPVSGWVHTARDASTIAADTAAAIQAARQAPGQIATLITPADATWGESPGPATVALTTAPALVSEAAILEAANALHSGEPTLLLLDGAALRETALELAGRIAAHCGARLSSPTFFARQARGAGRVAIDRLPYFAEQALQVLNGLKHLILVGARAPISFFAYPNLPSWLTPTDTQIHKLASIEHNLINALERLADAVGANKTPAPTQGLTRPTLPTGILDPLTIAHAVGALMPENCIVIDESATSGWGLLEATAGAPPHDWLVTTGGAIGNGPPLTVGAAVACPDRRVLGMQADGSAAYTMQALWTQAREQLNVTTILFANRAYRILEVEYMKTESGQQPGPRAAALLNIAQPELRWSELARGMGVPATRVETIADFNTILSAYLHEPGPNLIEVML